MEVDEALSRLGRFGRWQMIRYCLVCLSVTVSGCWHMMVIVFTGGEPEHHCRIHDNSTLNVSLPTETRRGEVVYASCSRYANPDVDNVTTPCDMGWTYTPAYETTIVTEWNLVCDKNYLVETSQSVFNFGVMVGAVVFTALADRIGRKPVHLGCQYAMIVVGLAIAFAPTYIAFVVLRFLLGAIREGAGLVGIVMACELFPAPQRTFAGTALELFWAAAWMALALMAYLITHWRYLQLAVTLPPILTIALVWLLPESVPWLVANGRLDEAEAILHKAAKTNGVQFPAKIFLRPGDHGDGDVAPKETRVTVKSTILVETKLEKNRYNSSVGKISSFAKIHKTFSCCGPPGRDRIQEHVLKHRRYTCLDILRSKTLVLYTFVMCSVWFASGVVYFGLSLSTSTMAGNKYVNFFLSGAVEAPAYALTVVVLQKYGRRWPLFIFHMVAAVVLFINVFLPEKTEGGVSLVPLIVTLTMVGKFSMTAAFGTAILYAPEIYPTNLRNLGFGFASVWGRIGGMIAPFASYIGKIVPWIPGLVFSIVAVVTGVGVFFLPETLNRPLPETIEEIESWGRGGWGCGPIYKPRHRQENGDETSQGAANTEGRKGLVEADSTAAKEKSETPF